ncbi:MAG: DUF4390 domain-containing protein [Gammaproteobacteria bacterium]
MPARARLWSCAGAALLALWLLPVGDADAKDRPFEIRSATSRLSDGVWFANARIDYRLSDDALEALENGVSLTIQLQIEVFRLRRFWTDAKVASLKQGYLLSYQPLSERYVIKNLNSGEQNSFATLFSALNHMGRVVDLPLIDASILDPDARYDVTMRAILDQDTLPGPLRMIAFWSEGFRLVSNKYTWQLGD